MALPPAPDLVPPAGGPVDVSFVIPCFNYGRFLDECLASLYHQRGVSFEIIVIDDGSTDETPERIERHLARVTYVRQANQGQSAARNAGLALARGRYVQLLDADDLIGPGSLAARMVVMRASGGRSLVVCRNRLFDGRDANGRVRTCGEWRLFERDLDLHLLRLNVAPLHAFLIPREVFDAVGAFNADYRGVEDYDLFLRAAGAGYGMAFCGRGLVYYRKHAGSVGAAKARNRAYPFDVLVHWRKHTDEYGASLAARLGTPAGSLALLDGVLHTAEVVDPAANPEGHARLLSIADERLAGLKSLASARRAMPIERLYLARLAQRVAGLTRLGHPDLAEGLAHLVRAASPRRSAWLDVLRALPWRRYDDLALAAATLKRYLG